MQISENTYFVNIDRPDRTDSSNKLENNLELLYK